MTERAGSKHTRRERVVSHQPVKPVQLPVSPMTARLFEIQGAIGNQGVLQLLRSARDLLAPARGPHVQRDQSSSPTSTAQSDSVSQSGEKLSELSARNGSRESRC